MPRKMTKNVRYLSADALESTSVRIDWSEARGEGMEGWRSFEAERCEECGEYVVLDAGQGDEEHRYLDSDSNCHGVVSTVNGPMMNYFYPVKIDDCEEAARAIDNLPLCVVQFEDGKTALALTGGGMDLSWEIAEAFIRIGYLPPLAFTRLPAMAGKTLNTRTRTVLAACVRSNRVAISQARMNLNDLDRTREHIREHEQKQPQRASK